MALHGINVTGASADAPGRRPPDQPPLRPGARLTGRRAWLLRLALAVVAPAAVLGLAEAGLRLGGYGYDPHLFVRPAGSDVYVANGRFGERFFPKSMARDPDYVSFAARKDADACRIFILGSSAAMGVPDPSFAFGRILRVMLEDRYAGVRFEVVNTAMTAINSHAVRVIAEECAGHQPDLFIVYLGNNEVVGAYGPGTVFADFSASLPLVRASIAVRGTRVGQLIADAMEALARRTPPAGWGGMEMFSDKRVAADDPRLAKTYEHFQANLRDIWRAARHAGAPVIFCTVVTNLKDCAPFASLHRQGLSDTDMAEWQGAYDAGAALEAKQDPAGACQQYAAAAAIDDQYADLAFRRARCEAALGRFGEARAHFIEARDLDALRFRADSRTNDIIRETGAALANEGAYLVDADNIFSAHAETPHGLVGDEWLYEHVHLNFRGNYLLARLLAEAAATILPPQVQARRTGRPAASAAECGVRLRLSGWTQWHAAEAIVTLVSQPPFTFQTDWPRILDAKRREVSDLARFGAAEFREFTLEAYETAIRKSPGDWNFHDTLAVLRRESGDYIGEVDEWRLLLGRFPGNPRLLEELGGALLRAGQAEEAVARLQEVFRMGRVDARILKLMGDAHFLQKDFDRAAERYRQALRLRLDYVEAHNNLAATCEEQGKLEEALCHFNEAAKTSPDASAYCTIARILVLMDRKAEAVRNLHKALEMNPAPDLAEKIRGQLEGLEKSPPASGP